MRVNVPPAQAFEPIRGIGGATSWYCANWLWRLRGWLVLLAGGAGMRRSRRDPKTLQTGDVVDCWRVEALEPDRRLRLAAEMKLPGRAWLKFEVVACENGSEIRQTASFDPAGFCRLAYWYAVDPLHELLFGGMLGQIAKVATRQRF